MPGPGVGSLQSPLSQRLEQARQPLGKKVTRPRGIGPHQGVDHAATLDQTNRYSADAVVAEQ